MLLLDFTGCFICRLLAVLLVFRRCFALTHMGENGTIYTIYVEYFMYDFVSFLYRIYIVIGSFLESFFYFFAAFV